MAKSVDARDLKSLEETRDGSSPSKRTIWCNVHQRHAHICASGAGGILLPCKFVDLTGILEVWEDEKNG